MGHTWLWRLKAFKDEIHRSAMRPLWQKADGHPGGSGLAGSSRDNAGPDLTVLKKTLQGYEKNGMHDRHTALTVVAAGAAWPRVRKKEADLIGTAICSRCGVEEETLLHYLWTCPCNNEICSPDVQETQKWVNRAKADVSNQCFWL